ncbi:MAG: hypothetical protein H6835_15670 [Planctomycetes bacterium]|nr:hypothetical protein [Planctomycetota bacterium]
MNTYDDNDPWHAEVNLMLAVYCSASGCNASVDMPVKSEEEMPWEQQCVETAERAQAAGWTRHDIHFYCPEHAHAATDQSNAPVRGARRTRRAWLVGTLVGVVLLGAAAVYPVKHWLADREFHDAVARNLDATAVSTDLEADLRLMWQTAPMHSQPDARASTIAAMMAASRVFNTIELVGKTGAEVRALLGSPQTSSDSVYRHEPFFPLTSRALVYRIENGMFGWEFHVLCQGDEEPVTAVERFAIE